MAFPSSLWPSDLGWELQRSIMCIPRLRDDDVVEWLMAVPEPGETKLDHHGWQEIGSR